ncbi:hypothetical protein [Salegentibacter sp. Hel_I_6]|uniref:hypothetical protein n=1 Tax=Salegentibacter sp. Hel_I_6 TaxID=1250278 RepID=UPI0005634453|nr:hypothetical protein [Salegentibacter sp. Hel_I_6]
MKAKLIDEAKKLAKAQSLGKDFKDVAIYIIYCNRTDYFYVDTNGFVRLWERFIGYYSNGVFYNA